MMLDLSQRKVDFSVTENHDIGWMSPEGHFYYTESMEHLSFARSAASQLYNDGDGDKSLYAHGWLSIHPYGMCGEYLFSWRGHLSEEQKRVLRPFAEKYHKYISNLTKLDLLEELDLDIPEEDAKYAPLYVNQLGY